MVLGRPHHLNLLGPMPEGSDSERAYCRLSWTTTLVIGPRFDAFSSSAAADGHPNICSRTIWSIIGNHRGARSMSKLPHRATTPVICSLHARSSSHMSTLTRYSQFSSSSIVHGALALLTLHPCTVISVFASFRDIRQSNTNAYLENSNICFCKKIFIDLASQTKGLQEAIRASFISDSVALIADTGRMIP